MNRISSIYSFISLNDKVVDVGCDQAKLSIMLSKRKQYSIAADISENVIKKAKEDIKDNKYIDLRISNGLENIKNNEADTLVLSGMGSYTIVEILKNTKLRFKKIITISNNKHYYLRKNMLDLNYIVDKELIIKENNKYYNLIIFKEGNMQYSEEELLIGLNHQDNIIYREYLKYLYNKYCIINSKSNYKNKDVNKYLKVINNKLNNIV